MPNDTQPSAEIERVAMKIAIAERWGLESDGAHQDRIRERIWRENWSDTDMIDPERESVIARRGRGHYRALAQTILALRQDDLATERAELLAIVERLVAWDATDYSEEGDPDADITIIAEHAAALLSRITRP